MKITLTPELKTAIAAELTRIGQDNAILDVYGVASKLQTDHPDENVAWEDIVQALLAGRGDIQAIEFTERAPEVLEVILPGAISDMALGADEDVIVVAE